VTLVRNLALAGLLLWAVGPANAEVAITGPATVPTWRLVELTASGAPAGAAYIWSVSPDDKADVRSLGDRCIFTGPSGQYKAKCWAVHLDGMATRIETAQFTVTINGTAPAPPGPLPPGPPTPPAPSPPSPTPPPSPVPAGTKLYAVIVTDLARRTPAEAALVADLTVGATGAALRAAGHEIRAYDTTSAAMQPATVPGGLNYKPVVDRVGAPCLILFPQGRASPVEPLRVVRLPATGAEVMALVKAVAP
jgi:hypothetical protein